VSCLSNPLLSAGTLGFVPLQNSLGHGAYSPPPPHLLAPTSFGCGRLYVLCSMLDFRVELKRQCAWPEDTLKTLMGLCKFIGVRHGSLSHRYTLVRVKGKVHCCCWVFVLSHSFGGHVKDLCSLDPARHATRSTRNRAKAAVGNTLC